MDADELKQIRTELDEVVQWVGQLQEQVNEAVQWSEDLTNKVKALEKEINSTSIPISPPVPKPKVVTVEQEAVVESPQPPPPPPPQYVPLPVMHETSPETKPPQPKVVVTPSEPVFPFNLGNIINSRIEASMKKTRELGWEVALGTFWLPRVAVLLIAIAVVYLLTLAINRLGSQWAPHFRIGMGYAVCAGFMFMAWKAEQKYREFARVMYGGGFALMYFVTFATHYVPFSRVIENPVVTLLLLAVIVVGWFIAAQYRKSKIIACMVTLLGHLTILISTLSIDKSAVFSMVGLLALTMGSAFFLLRNRWYYIAATGMLGGYLNYAVFLAKSHGNDPVHDFIGSMTILTILLMTFVLAELFAPTELRRKKVPLWFRTVFATTNTASFFVLASLIVAHYEFTQAYQYLFRFNYAIVLFMVGLAYKARERDPLYNAFFTKAVAVATLGLAAYYSGASLSAWFAVEGVALLVTSRQYNLVVSRILALLIAVLALIHTFATIPDMSYIAYDAPDFQAVLTRALLTLFSFLIASVLYQRTDWSLQCPATVPLPSECWGPLWQLDLLRDRPENEPTLQKPLQGLLFPYCYAIASILVFFRYLPVLVAHEHQFAVIAIFSGLMTLAAALLRSRSYGFTAFLLITAATVYGFYSIIHIESYIPAWQMIALAVIGTTALATETAYVGKHEGLAFHQNAEAPYFLYGIVTGLTGLFLQQYLLVENRPIGLGAAGIIAAILFLVLHPKAWAFNATILLVWASGLCFLNLCDFQYVAWGQTHYVTWALVLTFVAGNQYFAYYKTRTQIPGLDEAHIIFAWLLLMGYFEMQVDEAWRFSTIAVFSFLFAVYAFGTRSRSAVVVSLIGALLASLRHIGHGYNLSEMDNGIVWGYVLLALYWIAAERATAQFAPTLDKYLQQSDPNAVLNIRAKNIAAVFIVLLTVLLLNMLYQLPHLTHANRTLITMGWFALGVGLILMSLVAHEKFYRYCGLAVIVLSIARVFLIDMRQQNALLRIAAFTLLGVGLLPISYGYHRWMTRLRTRGKGEPETDQPTTTEPETVEPAKPDGDSSGSND